MSIAPATEFVAPSGRGRTFTAARRVRLGDVDGGGELRLDSIARYLQDVATDDALDAGLPNAMGWLVRRTMIRVDRPVRLNDHVELTTFCSGRGRSWAERRTLIRCATEVCVEAVCLWVQVDIATGRPMRLDDDFDRLYAESAAGRVVSSKLSLPRLVPPGVAHEAWRFRATDVDPFGHVNNAAQWVVVEHRLQATGMARIGAGELEYVAPVDEHDDLVAHGDGSEGWLTVDGEVRTSWRWHPG